MRVADTTIYQQVPVGKLVHEKHRAYLNMKTTEQLPDEVWSLKQWGAKKKQKNTMKWKLVQSWSCAII